MKRCPQCHRTYSDDSFSFCLEDGNLLSAPVNSDATLVLPDQRTKSWDDTVRNFAPGKYSDFKQKLAISLNPSDPDDFLLALLRTRKARIITYYANGKERVQIWNAIHIRRGSNVIGNLRSRPDFRQGRWQELGIARVRVEVIE